MTSEPFSLQGKTALVIGASRGAGRAIALDLARAGAHVIALARTVGGLEELDDEIKAAGGAASLVSADISDPAVTRALGAALTPRFRSIDLLVLAAAEIGALSPVADYDEKTWTRVFETNFTAQWRILKALDPLLRASGDARVIVLSSEIGGERAQAYWSLYAASKAALERLAECYAAETAIAGISVAILDPGPMRTKLRRDAMPGESPASLPDPSVVLPLLWRALSSPVRGATARLTHRDA